MNLRVATIAVMMTLSHPAWATSSVFCAAPDDNASLSLTIGNVPVLAVLDATIVIDDAALSMSSGDVLVGQQMMMGDLWAIDFVDPNVEQIRASVRLAGGSENGRSALGGLLTVTGFGAYALICEGP